MDFLNPPPIVFQIVWPILYTFLFFYFCNFLIDQKNLENNKTILCLFLFGIFLNILWIYIFFQLKLPNFPFLILILMILLGFFLLYFTYKNRFISWRQILNFIMYIVYQIWLLYALLLLVTKNET